MRRAELILNSSAFISKKLFSRRFVARDLHGAKSIWLYALHDNVLKLKRINFFFKCCADAFFFVAVVAENEMGRKTTLCVLSLLFICELSKLFISLLGACFIVKKFRGFCLILHFFESSVVRNTFPALISRSITKHTKCFTKSLQFQFVFIRWRFVRV